MKTILHLLFQLVIFILVCVIMGLFSKENNTVLNSLRIIGNDAAHDLKSPSQVGLKDAISIIEHTLEHIYELKMKTIK